VPQEKKQQASTFKEYEPGYLHIDVTYLPKLAGKKQYLFINKIFEMKNKSFNNILIFFFFKLIL
jgi:hypothetical protein